jgi:hypothetical protein
VTDCTDERGRSVYGNTINLTGVDHVD